jgi:hypothetical protein
MSLKFGNTPPMVVNDGEYALEAKTISESGITYLEEQK